MTNRRQGWRTGALAAVSCLLVAASPVAPQTATPSCAGADFHQLDFWVGDWALSWQGGTGTNHITRELGGCVVHEHFAGDASVSNLHGESVSVFEAATKLWRQTWVDDQGGYIPLTGGPKSDGTFELETTRLDPTKPRTRMIFENIKPDSFTWRWKKSTDDGKTWSDSWVIDYKRKA